MSTSTIWATIERRLLVNYRLDPDVAATLLPPPFRPALVDGHAVAGICLIRLGGLRPAGLPAAAGLTTENAAHRIAAEWDTPAGPVTGVYIPRRDTSSRLVALLGGRAFPGWHHRADFEVHERPDRLRVGMRSRDGDVRILVRARPSDTVMDGSVFPDLDAASTFFRTAPVGHAATPNPGTFDGVELRTTGWALEPLQLEEVVSSWFDDPARVPPRAAVLDSGFLMCRLETAWVARPDLVAATR